MPSAEPGAASIRQLIAAQAARAPERPVFEAARDDRRISYAALDRAAGSWCAAVGAEPGADLPVGPVVLACRDPLRFAVAYLGLLAAGRVVVPVDAAAPVPDLAPGYAATAPVLVVTDLPELSTELTVLRVRADGTPDGDRGGLPAPSGASGAVLLASSGTTGPRKGIRLPERALLHTAAAVVASLRLGPADRGFNPLPLFHVNAEVVGLLATLTAGSTLVLDARFSRTGFWELIAEREITWVNAVPAVLAILAGTTDRPPMGRIRFFRSASAPLPAPVLQRFEEVTGIAVLETYGMTEAASQLAATPADGPRKAGSVGPAAGVELRVLHADGSPAGVDVVGRVQVRGAAVIAGYELGEAADRFGVGGWLDTGDLGRLDADGYLYLAGREGDVINRGGEKVFPRDVEEVLLADPAVREAVVVARPHPVLGEEPVAWIVLAPGGPDAAAPVAVAARLRQRCAAALSRYQLPADVLFAEVLPTGPTGKVSRAAVAQLGANASAPPA